MKRLAKRDQTASRKKVEVRTDAFVFRWAVNEAGYEWENGLLDGKPHLVARSEPGKGIRIWEPSRTVFAEFARTEPTREGIKLFAEKCGDLFNTYGLEDKALNNGVAKGGTSLKAWQSEIDDMRVLVELWQSVKKHKLSELKKVVWWEKYGQGHRLVSYQINSLRHTSDTIIANSASDSSGLRRFRDGDVLLPARCALQLEINKRLSEHPTMPRLAWTPDTPETSGGNFERLIFTPPNLLAAMWLGFAQAVAGQLELNWCEQCGKPYQIGPGGRRSDSNTCGDACKQKKWRKEHGS